MIYCCTGSQNGGAYTWCIVNNVNGGAACKNPGIGKWHLYRKIEEREIRLTKETGSQILMKYEYTYRNTPEDYWKFRIENYYRNWTALVSVVFTLSILALTLSKWNATNGLGKAILVLLLILFPVIQPLFTYFTSIRDAQAIKVDTTLAFDEKGMEICVQKHIQRIPWKKFVPNEKGGGMVILRKSMLVIVPDQIHAYLIPNRAFGTAKEKEVLFSFITGQLRSAGVLH